MNVSEKSYIARLDVDKTLAGKNLNEADFYQSKELSCIAIERDGALQDLNSVILQTGDTLIMYGNRRSMHRLRMSD
jgi:Trk K+ transport system NAD-binding subunit